ncbi:MAG: hypothetical protein KUG70_01765 [Rhodobacteraceae bacterium]|nr:hypothetical protein [Paracoccaceae bacterium]
MTDQAGEKTGLADFDEALSEARSEMSATLPDAAALAGMSAAPVSAIAELDRQLSERFTYPLLVGQANAIFTLGKKRLGVMERSLKRQRRWLAVRFWWRRNFWLLAMILLGIAVLAALGAAYYYRAEIQQWISSMLPTRPTPPAGASGGTTQP